MVGKLKGLQQLGLDFCKSLNELPFEIGQLRSLQKISLFGCALQTPPLDVVRRGTDAVLQYLRDLSFGDEHCFYQKIVLVGDQTAGKSSLIESLIASKPSPTIKEERTVGIDVRKWRPKSSKVVAQVYDAAGHKTYHASHRMFMSRDALYLNV
eukprot:2142827-Rhodomonas_salina.1